MAERMPIRVQHFQRKRRKNRNFSVEQVFADVRYRLQDRFDIQLWIAPFLSNGVFRRILIVLLAVFRQRQVNHVTGDINFCCLLLSKRRTLLTILDCQILARCQGLKRAIIRLLWFKLPVLRSRFVTVISSSVKETLVAETGCDPDKVHVIYVAISPAFQREPKVFNSKLPILLQIGTGPNKNVIRLAEALNGIPCILNIVGPLSSEQKTALNDNKVDYRSFENLTQDEIIGLYKSSDIVTFVSTFEGFGMPILEANATGRPVITASVTSMPEIAGNAACIVDPMDVNAIKQGILQIVEDQDYREQLVSNGYANVKRFCPDGIAGRYAHLYEMIAAGNNDAQ